MKNSAPPKGNLFDSGFVTLQLGSATTTTSNVFSLPQEKNSLNAFLEFIGRCPTNIKSTHLLLTTQKTLLDSTKSVLHQIALKSTRKFISPWQGAHQPYHL